MRPKICLIGMTLALAACGSNEASKVETSFVESEIRAALEERFPDNFYGPVTCARDSDTHASCTVKETMPDIGHTEEKGVDAVISKEDGSVRWSGE